MADILIRGMEMPESCGMCDAQGLKNAVWHLGYGCDGDIDDFANCPPTRCPIVPLSEKHGRLIDADAPIRVAIYTRKSAPYGTVYETTPYRLLCEYSLLDLPEIVVPAEGDKAV